MSLEDRTNESIDLVLHIADEVGDRGIVVDVDSDSYYWHEPWVNISLTDDEHDSDTIRLTLDEAGLLHDRLGLILGRMF